MIESHARRIAKNMIDVIFAAKVGALRMMGVVDFPVPPNHNIRATSSATLRHYYFSGLTTAIPIMTAAIREGVNFRNNLNVLDFGCGVARQLLHFTRLYPQSKYHGCDVNHDSIGFVNRAYPQVDAYVSKFDPPLKWADGTFDVIYSVSIFSHLSPGDRDLWLAELYRVTKPGGVCLLTFNGMHSLRQAHKNGHRGQFTEEMLQKEGFIFDADQQEFDTWKANEAGLKHTSGILGITRLYGEMYHSADFARTTFSKPGFQVAALLDGVIDDLQDLIVLKKPG